MGKRLLVLIVLFATACMTGEAAEELPADEELAELDAWAEVADSKADLPASWSHLVAWLRDVYINKMSAVWHNQEHPASTTAALERIRGLVAATGIDPTRALYPTRVQRLNGAVGVDHSEVNIMLPGGKVVRLVGDPKGAGAFLDSGLFKESIGPRLCLNWSELQKAIEASYVNGDYGYAYVCHSITERVLRALGVGTASFSTHFRTYSAARWIWGPGFPSFNSQDPGDWSVSRQCN